MPFWKIITYRYPTPISNFVKVEHLVQEYRVLFVADPYSHKLIDSFYLFLPCDTENLFLWWEQPWGGFCCCQFCAN
jgi:hypothetical protein